MAKEVTILKAGTKQQKVIATGHFTGLEIDSKDKEGDVMITQTSDKKSIVLSQQELKMIIEHLLLQLI